MSRREGGVLGRLCASLTTTREQLDAEDERRERLEGTVPIADLDPRAAAVIGGVLTAVTYPPAGQAPILRARLFDGTATIELVFLGRRTVPGIEPGRRLRARGTPAVEGGAPVMYNPVVELLPVADED